MCKRAVFARIKCISMVIIKNSHHKQTEAARSKETYHRPVDRCPTSRSQSSCLPELNFSPENVITVMKHFINICMIAEARNNTRYPQFGNKNSTDKNSNSEGWLPFDPFVHTHTSSVSVTNPNLSSDRFSDDRFSSSPSSLYTLTSSFEKKSSEPLEFTCGIVKSSQMRANFPTGC